MATQEVYVELLVGTRVVDAAGKAVGRIEELHAEPQNGDCVIVEFLVGSMGLLRRFSVLGAGPLLAKIGGERALGRSYTIPWHQLDLSDAAHPRLLCKREELRMEN